MEGENEKEKASKTGTIGKRPPLPIQIGKLIRLCIKSVIAIDRIINISLKVD
jgi:hypothetical protein